MSKKIFFLFMIISFSCHHLNGQSLTEVMTDKEKYLYEIGSGKTIEEADQNALSLLANRSAQIMMSSSSNIQDGMVNEQNISSEKFDRKSFIVNNIYLENIGRKILSDHNGEKRVLRFVLKNEWENRFEACKDAIEEYLFSAVDAKKEYRIDEALRYFTWSYVLLTSYPRSDISIPDEEMSPKQFCVTMMNEIFRDLEINVIGIEDKKKKSDLHFAYPFQLLLDITYKGEPVDFLNFSYFDGQEIVLGATAKDGRSAVDMKSLPSTFDLHVEYLHENLAQTLNPNVYSILQNPVSRISLPNSILKIETCPPGISPKKTLDTSSEKIKSVVKEKLEEAVSKQIPVSVDLKADRIFGPIMSKIVKGISENEISSLKEYFTESGWNDFIKIVASGSPKIIRTPEFRYFQVDTLVICRSIPVRLRFRGNRSFVEDITFRMSTISKKITGIAYALSSKTEENIMSMKWDDYARLMLINFLEDYRTAYCLKDIDFLEKIFADDAYIIVGKTLRSPEVISRDISPISVNNETTIYQTKTKRQYMSDLRESFRSKQFVNVRFEECDPAKGFVSKEGIYAVQVRQHYFSNNYADNGFLTLAIDMRDKSDPLIKVRVWQKKKDKNYTAQTMIEKTVSTENSLF